MSDFLDGYYKRYYERLDAKAAKVEKKFAKFYEARQRIREEKGVVTDEENRALVKEYYDPTEKDVHVDAPLTRLSIAYRNEGYIADRLFPVFPVKKASDVYYVMPRDTWLLNQVRRRGAGGRAAEAGYSLTTSNYNCVEWALATIVPDRVRENADDPLNPDQQAVEFVTDQIMLAREVRVANLVTSITTVGSGVTPTNLWSNGLTSDPIADIRTGQAFIRNQIGRRPNLLILSFNAQQVLLDHPLILERIKYDQTADTNAVRKAMSGVFDVPTILLGESVVNNAAEGGTASYVDVWGNHAVLAYVNPNIGLRTLTAGLMFAQTDRQIRSGREERDLYDWVEAREVIDERILDRNCIYTFTSVV